ncbi:DUF3054 domain-containing protein [Laceyella putida]|uniref:DUF3054 domain-containing protein n=1 Tax=Laceyella putida TaxID=110101 RepID=A0ABW2RJS8_9BACL
MRQSYKMLAPLLSGDLSLFLYFSWQGRVTHHLPLDMTSILVTACPFIVAWLLVATTMELYRSPHPQPLLPFWLRLCGAVWISTCLGTALRAWLLRHPFDWLFLSVTTLFMLVAFSLWRLGWQWAARRWMNRAV